MRGNHVILEGSRDSSTDLWQLGLQPGTLRQTTQLVHQPGNQPSGNNVHELTVKQDIVTYLHQACFSPIPSTWLKAIDAGHFATWSGLTIDLVRKHLAKSVATSKGHMRQERQHLPSTKTLSLPLPHSKEAKTAPGQTAEIGGTHNKAAFHERTHCVYMKPIAVAGQIHSDQTGRFPITSSRSSKYIMVVYDYDSNAILTKPLTSRTETELLQAYSKLHDYLTARVLKPVLQRPDNEAPGRLQSYMRAKSVAFQLLPPHNHRRNTAEKAIGTWKEQP
jgi:hypothetical protein